MNTLNVGVMAIHQSDYKTKADYFNKIDCLFPQSSDSSHDPNDIHKQYYCNTRTCTSPAKTVHPQSMKHEWAVLFKCGSCRKMWHLCTLCPINFQPDRECLSKTAVIRLTKTDYNSILVEKLNHHNRTATHHMCSHEIALSVLPSDEDSANDLTLDVPPDDWHDSVNDTHHGEIQQSIFEAYPFNERREEEYQHVRIILFEKFLHKNYTEYLIKKTWVKNFHCLISKEDCNLFIHIVQELMNRSRDECQRFTDIICKMEMRNYVLISNKNKQINLLQDEVEKKMKEITALKEYIPNSQSRNAGLQPNQQQERNTVIPIKLPTTNIHARRILEGKNSFVSNLLIPRIYCLTDGYSYVQPSESLPLAMGLGLDFEQMTAQQIRDPVITQSLRLSSIFRSPAIQNKIISITAESFLTSCPTEDIYEVPCGLWMDGFDNSGSSKKLRSVLKLITYHICNHNVSLDHVYLGGLGKDSGNHNLIRNKIMDDFFLREKNPVKCFIPSLKKSAYIRFFLGYVIMDRVEHAEFTGFMAHSGIFSSVPGVSCPIAISKTLTCASGITVKKYLASCSTCYSKRMKFYSQTDFLNGSVSVSNCPLCDDWDMKLVKYEPHKEYPREERVDGVTLTLGYMDITFDTMIQCCR